MAADDAQKIAAEIKELKRRIAELEADLQKIPDKGSPGKAAPVPPEPESTIFRSLHDPDTQLLQKMINFQETERQLISHDIHDGAVQDVVGAKMLLEALTSHLSPTPGSHATEQFQAIGDALTRAIIDLRRLISELRPLVMDEEGIVEAIRFLISEPQHAADFKITFTHTTSGERYHPMLEGNLFRIVGEALTNARRHSDAAAVSIHLEEREEMLYLTFQDNGIGFRETEIDTGRFGLHGIRERARLFGGKAEIISDKGKGTTIKVAIPVSIPTA